MKRLAPKTRLLIVLFSAIPAATIVPGCSGGSTQTPNPQSYVGSYVGTYSATYDPRSPLSGTISGTLKFVISSDGTVTVPNPVQPSSGSNGGGTGSLSGIQIAATGNNAFFGLRLLQGQLQVASGQVTGSGTITVASQSELAYGTWQAHKQ